jgi:hypothetical protein
MKASRFDDADTDDEEVLRPEAMMVRCLDLVAFCTNVVRRSNFCPLDAESAPRGTVSISWWSPTELLNVVGGRPEGTCSCRPAILLQGAHKSNTPNTSGVRRFRERLST